MKSKTTNINLGKQVGEAWDEFRCQHCNKLLGKHNIMSAKIDIKCLRCGKINSVLNDVRHLIIITDKKGKIIFANDQLKAITGYSSEEVIGKTPAIWGKQMNKEFYKDLWEQILQKKKAVVVKLTNKRKDGTTYEALNRISPILNEKGEVDYFLGIQTLV